MAGNRAAVTSRTMSLCSLKKKESPRIISAEAPRSLNWSSAGPIASRLSASAISTPTPSAAAAFLIDANCSSLHASLGLLKEAFPDMVSNLARPDGNITGFASLSLELHIYIARRPPELVDEIGPIGDQAAGGGEAAFKIDCGQFVTGRQRNDQIAMKRSRPAPRYDQTPVRRAHEGRKGALSLMWGAHVDWVYLDAERRGQGLDDAELADSGGVRGISKDCYSRNARRNLLQQLQPFSAQAVFIRHEAGRARLSTKPAPTGSPTTGNTIGTVRVACSNGPTVEAPKARMTSGASAANSAACLRMSATLVVAQRVSMRTLRPIVHPDCWSPCKNAPTRA